MFFNDYQPENIRPSIVEQEGQYLCKVNEVIPGQKDNVQYVRIDCIIDAPGYPHVSLFLTAGENFNSRFTAFCDTFGIARGNQNFEDWKGKKGWLDIKLRMKDGYKNMVPYYITDETGWVIIRNQQQPAAQAPQQQNNVSYGRVDYGSNPGQPAPQKQFNTLPDEILF